MEIVDNTEKNGKYHIVVTNMNDINDNDYCSVSYAQVEGIPLRDYISECTKVYVNDENKIDYVSLSVDDRLFKAKERYQE